MAQLERGALRNALLDEVRKTCAQEGPEAVSITKIGKKLGVSSGAPFRIFASRDHIFAALIETEMTRLDEALATIWSDPDLPPQKRLEAICAAYLDHANTDSAMFRLAFSVSAKAMGAGSLQTLGEEVYGKVRAAVAACLPTHSPEAETEMRCYILWAAIHGHAVLKLTGQTDDQSIEIADATVIQTAMRAVLQPKVCISAEIRLAPSGRSA